MSNHRGKRDAPINVLSIHAELKRRADVQFKADAFAEIQRLRLDNEGLRIQTLAMNAVLYRVVEKHGPQRFSVTELDAVKLSDGMQVHQILIPGPDPTQAAGAEVVYTLLSVEPTAAAKPPE